MRIEVSGLTRRFGRLTALDHVDLTIEAGRRTALIGPNGSGKSTLTRILMGLMDAEGEVRVGGLDPRRDRMALARRMAYVPQIAPQFRAPVGDIVRAVAGVRGLSEDAVARLADRLALDLGALRRRPFHDLSGGMKQKLLIALALAARPEWLLMDEPTASLDAAARDRFYALFAELPPTTGLLLCSHRLDEIRHLVDDVAALSEGRLVWHGPAAQRLAAQAISIVELHLRNGRFGDRLAALGFKPGAGGWWIAHMDSAAKMRLLPGLTGELGGELINLVVRDMETIEPKERDHAEP